MSWRRWQGWEPRQTTAYEYDAGGRLIRSVTTREAEWDTDNRTWSVALLDHEASLCGDCGHSLVETTNPAYDGYYHVDEPARCYRCTAIAVKAEKYHRPLADGRPSSDNPQTLRFPVTFHKPSAGG